MKNMMFLEIQKTISISEVFNLEKHYHIIIKDENEQNKNTGNKHISSISICEIIVSFGYLIINACFVWATIYFCQEYFAKISKLQVVLNILFLILLKIIIIKDDKHK